MQDSKTRAEILRQAIEYFEQAVAKDPNHAPAYVALAQSYTALAGFGTITGQESRPKIKTALVKALAIDEKIAEAHQLLGQLKFWEWDWPGAEAEFQRARELDPKSRGSFFFNYAALLAATGRFDEALAEVRRVNEFDPDPARAHFSLGFILYWARRYDEAVEHHRKAIEANGGSHFYLGFAYAQKSRFKEAVEEFEKVVVAGGRNAGAVAGLGYGHTAAGNTEEAMKILKELEEGYQQPFVHFPSRVPGYRVAAIYAALGDKDRALEWLEKDYRDQGGWMIWLNVDPIFDPLRSDPRFQDLLRRMKIPE